MNFIGKCVISCMVLFLLFGSLQPGYAAKVTVDFSAPSVPTGLTIENRTYTTLLISWNASSDNTAVRGYQVYRDGKKIITISKTSFTNTDLIPGREYVYTIRAYDAAGNVSDGSVALKGTTLSDLIPPSVPGELAVSSTTYTSITLSWKPSTDNTSVKGYEIYCNDSRKASTSATSYICKSLEPGRSYVFSVKAYDIAGNYSNTSNYITACTLPDVEAPTVPTGLKITELTGTEAVMEWLPSTDNVKVKGYEIYSDGVKIGKISKTEYKLKQLLPGKSYNISIRAYDMTGNMSGASSVLKITTTKDLEVPSAPNGLKVKSIKGTSVSLTWNESEDDIKVKGYRIYCNGLQIATSTYASKTVKVSKDLIIGVFYVKAYDLVENLSAASNKVTVLF